MPASCARIASHQGNGRIREVSIRLCGRILWVPSRNAAMMRHVPWRCSEYLRVPSLHRGGSPVGLLVMEGGAVYLAGAVGRTVGTDVGVGTRRRCPSPRVLAGHSADRAGRSCFRFALASRTGRPSSFRETTSAGAAAGSSDRLLDGRMNNAHPAGTGAARYRDRRIALPAGRYRRGGERHYVQEDHAGAVAGNRASLARRAIDDA